MFIAVTMNHIRAVKAWGEAHGGQANLNVLTFELEVKARNRYYTLFPQFLLRMNNGRLCHAPQLSSGVTGFIGWLPYRPTRWSLTADKMVFKQRLGHAGLPTPAMWNTHKEATQDYLIKSSVGSFGKELAGPYRVGELPNAERVNSFATPEYLGHLYAEAFVQGTNVKVWFWGEHAFHAHVHDYPIVVGDGEHDVQFLTTRLIHALGRTWENYNETVIKEVLAYQGVTLNTVLPAGRKVWLDYRYGRRFAPDATSEEEDNALPRLERVQRAQIDRAGQWLASEIAKERTEPVMYSLDGVLDSNGRIWWLEINSNPIFPPTGYPTMFATLFGTPLDASTSASGVSTNPRASLLRQGVAGVANQTPLPDPSPPDRSAGHSGLKSEKTHIERFPS